MKLSAYIARNTEKKAATGTYTLDCFGLVRAEACSLSQRDRVTLGIDAMVHVSAGMFARGTPFMRLVTL